MTLTTVLYDAVKDIWEDYYDHPFIKGIGDGSLNPEKFRYYMIQDYLYLLEYVKVFAFGIIKSTSETEMRYFSDCISSILNSEMKIHKNYMKKLSITNDEIIRMQPALDNISYTSYMLSISMNQGLLELLVSILACAWSYQLIGEHLAQIEGAADHILYGEWIKGYSSEEYRKGNEIIFKMVNLLGENATDTVIDNAKQIFINCSRYEKAFWDLAEMRKL